MADYNLIDGELQTENHPLTFAIPDKAERTMLADHCLVQVGFLVEPSHAYFEPIWVQVIAKEESEDLYYGTLQDKSVTNTALRIHDEIQFTSKNVLRIQK